MNNNDFHRALADIKSVRLSLEEKASLKKRIFERVASTPAAPTMPVVSPYVRGSWMSKHRALSTFSLVAAVIIMSGGGAAFASEKALPGDILYPLKVAVIEPIRGGLAISAEAKASWQASRVNARLAEAEVLSEESRLDEDRHSEINLLINKHSVAFDAAVKAVGEKESPERATEIEAELAVSLDRYAAKRSGGTAVNENADVAVMMMAKAVEDTADVIDPPASDPILSFDIYTSRRQRGDGTSGSNSAVASEPDGGGVSSNPGRDKPLAAPVSSTTDGVLEQTPAVMNAVNKLKEEVVPPVSAAPVPEISLPSLGL